MQQFPVNNMHSHSAPLRAYLRLLGIEPFSTDRFALDELFDSDGSAFILHANADNYANIPTDHYDPDPDTTTRATGDAGARVACRVIEQK